MASNNEYSISIANAIKRFLDDDDWKYAFDESRGLFDFGLNLSCKLSNARYKILVRDNSYTVYAYSPLSADAEDKTMLASMAQFLHGANYGLRNGNFELDFNDGEIRYKSFVDCEGSLPSTEIIKNSIYIPASMIKRYSGGIVEIIVNSADPSECLKQCEGGINEPSDRTSTVSDIEDMDVDELRRLLEQLTGGSD